MVPAAGNNQRLCLYGAFNYKNGQVHYMSHPKKDSKRFAQFLSQLLSHNSERFMISVLDNASYHCTRKILLTSQCLGIFSFNTFKNKHHIALNIVIFPSSTDQLFEEDGNFRTL